MTRAHEIRHRPGCQGELSDPSRVGPWAIRRCSDCRATEVRRVDDTKETQK